MKKDIKISRLQKRDYELVAELRYTIRQFLRFSEQAARRHRVTPQQYQALLSIEGYPGRDHVTVGELAEQLQIAPHSAVGLVDRLEKIELVKREAAPDDGRKVWVSLSQKGLQLLEKLFLTHRSELRSVGPRIGALLRDAAERMPVELEAL